jgi:Gas vesicle protein G
VGLLFNILTLPVTGPLKATTWIAEQVLDVAEREYYDEGALRQSIAGAEAALAAGEITDQEYEARVDALLERLLAAREYRAMKE